MHCDWLKKVTGHEAMCQGLRETACKGLFTVVEGKKRIALSSMVTLTLHDNSKLNFNCFIR